VVLGIETSCDETGAALVAGDKRIVAERLLSQIPEHQPYGGVVPEVAARAHLLHLDRLIAEAMDEAGLRFSDLAAVAAAGGPGLIGGLIVGVMTAKALAAVQHLPFIAVNHLEAHALSPRLVGDLEFPYLLLLVSGGHCQLLAVEGVGRYVRLGTTLDDAPGEAFDKVAKMLGLGYPGGPEVERAAARGQPGRFRFPRPMKGRAGFDFSFAGLKTAVRQAIAALPRQPPSETDVQDICAEFQTAVVDIFEDRCSRAAERFRLLWPQGRALVAAGGVAANRQVVRALAAVARRFHLEFVVPPQQYCTDNAAMIAWAGYERLRLGATSDLDFAPRPRWPLDPAAASS
jgi:N6-L-threonylcarbamoyladenine synthase